jgi:predicted amidohydrolase YtcJ
MNVDTLWLNGNVLTLDAENTTAEAVAVAAGRIVAVGSAAALRERAGRGLRFTIHTDAPVVPMTPMLLMWAAVNRRTMSGEALGPDQCLTPLEALRATTIDAAWQLRLERDRGSIEAGKRADFAVLSADPLSHPDLREIEVESTIVGGEPLGG